MAGNGCVCYPFQGLVNVSSVLTPVNKDFRCFLSSFPISLSFFLSSYSFLRAHLKKKKKTFIEGQPHTMKDKGITNLLLLISIFHIYSNYYSVLTI